MSKSRLEAFSDGVMAIILTILVLDIKLPDKYSWSVLWDAKMQFITYIASFLLVAMIWNQHHQMFLKVKKINGQVLWANIILLFWLSLIPVAAGWYGRNVFSPEAGVLFAVIVIFFNLAFLWLNHCVEKADEKANATRNKRRFNFLSILSLIVNIAAVFISYFFPPFVLIATFCNGLLWVIPIQLD
ncbi:TMEM175 family protein [Companilactobacillus sp.]|jgi:uncharacterized membrane protein|uniref:TMEM175 family protein n=1 Tax=Companilactobacillus sp. TaxID=2767905 RepID=UPI0025C12F1A|nr:TMEM175 family protein [Companilactobacillus sp.]MCH4009720.1 TMEM175 family protein [Companilactobacillus sp.]MCH4052604.1 TMEM175 family protein [Companilactobacillus sp.]MCH4077662.1 TMEM175 family protein [Companilactobacillus sp.]MCH4126238.1 TMEM175 family protein [Companilactobacillus sp.]MCI1311946.1 TMEM175 family protein [Companilactobacillus sp.]